MKRLIAAVVLVGIVLTSTASATILGTVNIQNHNNALSDIGTIWGGGLSSVTGRTGVYSWTNTHAIGTTNLGWQVPDWGFCIELIQGPYTGWHDVIPLAEASNSAPMGTIKANYIRELWGRHFDPTWTAPGGNTQMAEAFGTAIWEIIYETDPWDVTSGTGFYATGIEQYATANAWLNELDGTGPRANLAAISTVDGQDYVVQVPEEGQVPEPATVCLLGLGALSLLRRKR
jgi:hypothetical protein